MIPSSVCGVNGRISSWRLFPFFPSRPPLGLFLFFPSPTRTRLGLFPLFPSSNSDPSPPTSLGCRVSPLTASWSPFAAARPEIFGTGPALVTRLPPLDDYASCFEFDIVREGSAVSCMKLKAKIFGSWRTLSSVYGMFADDEMALLLDPNYRHQDHRGRG